MICSRVFNIALYDVGNAGKRDGKDRMGRVREEYQIRGGELSTCLCLCVCVCVCVCVDRQIGT